MTALTTPQPFATLAALGVARFVTVEERAEECPTGCASGWVQVQYVSGEWSRETEPCTDPWHTPLPVVGERVELWADDNIRNSVTEYWVIEGEVMVVGFGQQAGSATVAGVYPIIDMDFDEEIQGPYVVNAASYEGPISPNRRLWIESDDANGYQHIANISDQLPYANWSPGRTAIELIDTKQEETP